MKILVTGGRGFIGKALVRELEREGHDVFSFDLLHYAGPRHIRGDVRHFRELEACLDHHRFDLVYHLAAEAGRWNGESHYESLWTTNVVGTKHLIRLQERLRFRLVFFSSSEVYGDYAGVMSEEVMEQEPIQQLNDYAMTKWIGEMQILNSAKMFRTESVRVRLFNIYGPGEVFGSNRGFISRFIYHCLHGLPFTVYVGHQRTVTYVSDAVATLARITERFRPGAVYNIGSNEQYDIKAISDLIVKKVSGDERLISYATKEHFTTRAKHIDITKAIRELGHETHVQLEQGLDRTIVWARTAYFDEPTL